MARLHDMEAHASVTVRERVTSAERGPDDPQSALVGAETAPVASDEARGLRGRTDVPLSETYDIEDPRQLGSLGEEIAARYLERRGLDLVARNWRCRYGEADIVAREDGETVLVEVKTRLGQDVDPLEAVLGRKQQAYRRIGLAYLMDHEDEDSVRFDVIGVNVTEPGMARLRHLIGAYQWDS